MGNIKKEGDSDKLYVEEERIYEKMKVAIRVKEEISKKLRTTKGVHQESVMSPLLFNLYSGYR